MTNTSTKTNTPTKADLILEGVQMGVEANTASMIMINARIEMIASHLGLDVSAPILTKGEDRNKEHLLKSVTERLANIVKMTAEIEGHPEPSQAGVEQFIEKIKNENWEESDSTDEPDPFKGSIFEGAELVHPDPLKGTAFEGAQPVYPAATENPEFKTTRTGVKPDPKDGFTVYVWEQNGFEDVDFSDAESRKACWDTVVQFYCDVTKDAVDDYWLSQPWADHLCQEYRLALEDTEVTSPMLLPDPSDISKRVAQSAADGETEIIIKGITVESQVVEALMTAFMISAARFNMKIGEALLGSRMTQLGFKL